MDEDRRRRAAAVEEKRKRLEELKKKKAERAQKDATTGGGGGANVSSDAALAEAASTEQFNDYVNSLLNAPTPVPTSPPASATQAVSTEGGDSAEEVSVDDVTLKPVTALNIAKGLGKVQILPTATEYYHKGCQTDPLPAAEGGDPTNQDILGMTTSPNQMAQSIRRKPSRHNSLFQGDEPSVMSQTTTGTDAKEPSSVEDPPKKPPLSDTEKEVLVQDSDFQEFLSRSSLLVERMLGREETYNVFVDYSSRDRGDRKRGDGSDAITPLVQFHAEALTKDRPIMDVQWSPHYAELLLAAYNTQAARGDLDQDMHAWSQQGLGGTSSSSSPDGLVLLWSLAMQSRPEFRFECQSPVLTARFHDYDSHVVLGGTYSGQVVLWDTRAKSLPVQRTPLSTSGHTHPVYSMTMTGVASAPSLITASSDGRVCFWNLAKLDRPESTIELSYEPPVTSPHSPMSPTISPPLMSAELRARKAGGGPISISAFALNNEKGVEELVLGSESGHIYATQLQNRKSVSVRQYDAHFGLVTSLHRHPSPSKQLSSLLLSSSVDWSLRLWDLKRSHDALAVFNHGMYDYVADARWCPVHPAVFTSVTSGGDLYVWNLNNSLEVPVAKCIPASAFSAAAAAAAAAGTEAEGGPSSAAPPSIAAPPAPHCALTKVAWSGEGRKLAVGDAKGHLHVLGVADELIKSRMDEEVRLLALLEHGVGDKAAISSNNQSGSGGGGDDTPYVLSLTPPPDHPQHHGGLPRLDAAEAFA